jgi:dipeptidyl aminopeptidase/acylaminoacyl peptidase
MDKKKLLWFIGSAIIIIFLVVLVVVLTSQKKASLVKNPVNDLMELTSLDSPNNKLYYLEKNSQTIKKWDLTTNKISNIIKVSDKAVLNISYSPDLKQAVVQTVNPEDYADSQNYLIDLNTGKIIKYLSEYMSSITWSPDNKMLAYQYSNPNNTDNFLSIINLNDFSFKNLQTLEDDYIHIDWVDGNKLVYYPAPTEASKVDVNLFNLQTNEKSNLLKDLFVTNLKSFPNDGKLIMNTSEDYEQAPLLTVYDNKTSKLSKFRALINTATAELYKKDTIIATKNGGDDNEQESQVSEQFYLVSLKNGIQNKLKINLGKGLKVQKILTPINKNLFFIVDGQLYKTKM